MSQNDQGTFRRCVAFYAPEARRPGRACSCSGLRHASEATAPGQVPREFSRS